MANIKITDLTAATALGGTELFECVQSSSSVKASATQIKTFVGQSLTVSNAVGSFSSITVTTGAIPFNTITNRAYGSFLSTRDQTAVSANVTYLAAFDTAATFNAGVTVASSTNITFAAAGVYECSFNPQISNSDTNDHIAIFWLTKNGSTIANSATQVSVPKVADGGITFFEFNFQEQVAANDYLQVAWRVSNTALTIDYTASSGTVSAVPSITFIANRIG
jgi:hypothetical protein